MFTLEVLPLVTGVSISSDDTVRVNTGMQMTAIVTPSNAVDKRVTWECRSPGASISPNGYLTAGANTGTVIVRATTVDGGYWAEKTVTIINPVQSIRITGTPSVAVGKTTQLSAIVDPAGYAVTWNSSNTALATVNQNGLVSGVATTGAGNVVITATAGDKVATLSIVVWSGTSAVTPLGMFLWPLATRSTITSGFGPRWGTMHNGADLNAPHGTPVFAMADGEVIEATNDATESTKSGDDAWHGGCGNNVKIKHNSTYSTRYMHFASTVVKRGDPVKAGQLIGYADNTGDSRGDHLHFEVFENGTRVDPMRFFAW